MSHVTRRHPGITQPHTGMVMITGRVRESGVPISAMAGKNHLQLNGKMKEEVVVDFSLPWLHQWGRCGDWHHTTTVTPQSPTNTEAACKKALSLICFLRGLRSFSSDRNLMLLMFFMLCCAEGHYCPCCVGSSPSRRRTQTEQTDRPNTFLSFKS